MHRNLTWLCLSTAVTVVALTVIVHAADPAPQPEDEFFTIAQQTAYQVDPIKIRVVGKEDFQVHRIEVVAKVPAFFRRPFRKDDPIQKEAAVPVAANGKITFFGKCTNAEGLWHWDDCTHYEDSFSMEVSVARRKEYDPSGLNRPGYVIRGVKGGELVGPDTDGKALFFNGPPTTAQGPLSMDCPYRLVINTKDQNEVVQAISMEPIYKPPAGGREGTRTRTTTRVEPAEGLRWLRLEMLQAAVPEAKVSREGTYVLYPGDLIEISYEYLFPGMPPAPVISIDSEPSGIVALPVQFPYLEETNSPPARRRPVALFQAVRLGQTTIRLRVDDKKYLYNCVVKDARDKPNDK